jgi:hypothetical protein
VQLEAIDAAEGTLLSANSSESKSRPKK